jgi:aldose 1-epimerase
VTATIELVAGAARVVIAPAVGGSIAAFECDGKAILRPTPEAAIAAGEVRSFACFPLVPFSNRIADATLHWGGRDYGLMRYVAAEPHAIHGNGCRRTWSVAQRGASSLAIELEHDAAGERAREWPFPYHARQRFELIADGSAVRLELGLDIENTGSDAFPFGLGWHPYFDRDEDTELGFVARGVWHTDPSRLPTWFDAVPPSWNFDPPRVIGDHRARQLLRRLAPFGDSTLAVKKGHRGHCRRRCLRLPRRLCSPGQVVFSRSSP